MARQQVQDHDDDDHDYDDDDGGEDDDGEGGRIRSLDAIGDALERLERRVESLFSSGGGQRRPQSGGSGFRRPLTHAESADDTRRTIREELAALRRQESADAERGEVMTRIGKIEKALERPPRQLRRVEERMGWHKG